MPVSFTVFYDGKWWNKTLNRTHNTSDGLKRVVKKKRGRKRADLTTHWRVGDVTYTAYPTLHSHPLCISTLYSFYASPLPWLNVLSSYWCEVPIPGNTAPLGLTLKVSFFILLRWKRKKVNLTIFVYKPEILTILSFIWIIILRLFHNFSLGMEKK